MRDIQNYSEETTAAEAGIRTAPLGGFEASQRRNHAPPDCLCSQG